ncbi:MAG: hypothetical protein V4675_25140 [Verrucomicrobiota bacterium]
MSFETISSVSFWLIAALGLGVPAWLVFYPPGFLRAGPSFLRLLLGVLVTGVAIYALFYGFIYPAVQASADAEGALDGILLVPPTCGWMIGAIVTPVFFAVRLCCLAYRGPRATVTDN